MAARAILSCSTVSAPANCRTRPPTATRAATRSVTIAAAGPLTIPTLAALGLSPRGADAGRAGAGGAARGVGPDGRDVAGQGLGHRPLGADGARARPPVPDLSARLSRGDDRGLRVGASAGRCSATSWRRAPRSSTSSATAHMRTGHRSSTPRPTACSRLPRTRTWCRCRSSTSGAASPTALAVEGAGIGRVIARPFVGRPGALRAHRQPARLRDAADRARRCSTC